MLMERPRPFLETLFSFLTSIMCNMNDSGHCAECKRNKSPLGAIVSEVACSAFTLNGSHTDLRNRKNRLWTEQFEAFEDCGQWGNTPFFKY